MRAAAVGCRHAVDSCGRMSVRPPKSGRRLLEGRST